MILALDNPNGRVVGFVIKPNPSMSWRGLVIAYSVIATFSLAIAVSFYIIGLPLVLPFSGLELLALGAALYVTARRGGNREVIRITGDKIIIETGRYAPEHRQEFQRYWARLVLEQPADHWYPSRLLVMAHGKQIEVGKFLNEQERQGLAKELNKALSQAHFYNH